MRIRNAWQSVRTWITIRTAIGYVRSFDDRLLADMGLPRDRIAAMLTHGRAEHAPQAQPDPGPSFRPVVPACGAFTGKVPAACATPGRRSDVD